MVQVCQRTKTKHEMLNESIQQYHEVFTRATAQFEKVISVSVLDIEAGAWPNVERWRVGRRLQGGTIDLPNHLVRGGGRGRRGGRGRGSGQQRRGRGARGGS